MEKRKSQRRAGTDPRPTSDKSFQQETQKRLMELMSQHQTLTITSRQLQNPSGRDFLLILNTLLIEIDPQLQIKGKPEDEVPTTLRIVGYPFELNKKLFLAVGAPNTWPHFLAALAWLLDIVNLIYELDQYDLTQETIEYQNYEALSRAFALCISGQDFSEEIEDACMVFQERAKSVEQMNQNVKSALKNIKEEFKTYKRLTMSPRKLDEQIVFLRTEIQSSESAVEHVCKEKILEIGRDLEKVEKEIEEFRNHVQELEQKLKIIKEQVGLQKYQQEDIQAYNQDRENFNQVIEVLKQKQRIVFEQLEERKEMQKQRIAMLSEHIEYFNQRARIVPFEIQLNANSNDYIFIKKQIKSLKPNIDQKMRKFESLLQQLQRKTESSKQHMTNLNERKQQLDALICELKDNSSDYQEYSEQDFITENLRSCQEQLHLLKFECKKQREELQQIVKSAKMLNQNIVQKEKELEALRRVCKEGKLGYIKRLTTLQTKLNNYQERAPQILSDAYEFHKLNISKLKEKHEILQNSLASIQKQLKNIILDKLQNQIKLNASSSPSPFSPSSFFPHQQILQYHQSSPTKSYSPATTIRQGSNQSSPRPRKAQTSPQQQEPHYHKSHQTSNLKQSRQYYGQASLITYQTQALLRQTNYQINSLQSTNYLSEVHGKGCTLLDFSNNFPINLIPSNLSSDKSQFQTTREPLQLLYCRKQG